MEFFNGLIDEGHIKKEKQKAREIRHSQWWKRRCAKSVCYYCGQKIPPKELTMDHIVPISRGGRSTKSNVAPACKECNTKKKSMLPMEWDEYINSINNSINNSK